MMNCLDTDASPGHSSGQFTLLKFSPCCLTNSLASAKQIWAGPNKRHILINYLSVFCFLLNFQLCSWLTSAVIRKCVHLSKSCLYNLLLWVPNVRLTNCVLIKTFSSLLKMCDHSKSFFVIRSGGNLPLVRLARLAFALRVASLWSAGSFAMQRTIFYRLFVAPFVRRSDSDRHRRRAMRGKAKRTRNKIKAMRPVKLWD